MDDNFGNRLAHAMNLRNMRQKELAKAVNVTEATVSRYVNNKRSPDIGFIQEIVSLLHVSADYLLGFSDQIEISHAPHPQESSAKYRIISQNEECAIAIEDEEQIMLLDRLFECLKNQEER